MRNNSIPVCVSSEFLSQYIKGEIIKLRILVFFLFQVLNSAHHYGNTYFLLTEYPQDKFPLLPYLIRLSQIDEAMEAFRATSRFVFVIA